MSEDERPVKKAKTEYDDKEEEKKAGGVPAPTSSWSPLTARASRLTAFSCLIAVPGFKTLLKKTQAPNHSRFPAKATS